MLNSAGLNSTLCTQKHYIERIARIFAISESSFNKHIVIVPVNELEGQLETHKTCSRAVVVINSENIHVSSHDRVILNF